MSVDASRYSLSYLQPSGAAAVVQKATDDPWSEAVSFFSDPILRVLQKNGALTIAQIIPLLSAEGIYTPVDVNQLYFIVKHMIDDKRLSIVNAGSSPAELQVSLQLPR